MKILITGGAGFIGSHIVDIYVGKDYQVVVVDNLSNGSLKNLNPKAKFYQIDLIDYNKLEKVFKKEKPQIISHHAAQTSASKSVLNPIKDAKINIIGGLNLLELSAKYKIKYFIYASTAAVYGEPQKLPVTEKHLCNPQTPYGISKYAFEFYLKAKASIAGFKYIIFRYGNVYGPRQNTKGEAGVVAIFANNFLHKKQPKIFGDGNKTRDYIYVGDIARANLLILKSNKKNAIYNLGTGCQTSDIKLFDIFCSLITPLDPKFYPDRLGDIKHFYFDISLAKKHLNWQPETTLIDGIKRTIGYYKKIADIYA